MADASARIDASTDVDPSDNNQLFDVDRASDSSDRSKGNTEVGKALRRLAQNREAARKARLKKKAYVQQLESSRQKLIQVEQELRNIRQQGVISGSGDQFQSIDSNGALAFDIEYERWLKEHNRKVNELRSAVNSHAGDVELFLIVDGVVAHWEEIFRLKAVATKADVFHMLSGMWKTPTERCSLWLGGFRPSQFLKLLMNELEPLADQQIQGLSNLQQSSQQKEDELSKGMELLKQLLAKTLASGSPDQSGSSGNSSTYGSEMTTALGKLEDLEEFLCQADNLRQKTLQQMHGILTTHQSARALLAMNDYFSRFRALSSLWLARPKE